MFVLTIDIKNDDSRAKLMAFWAKTDSWNRDASTINEKLKTYKCRYEYNGNVLKPTSYFIFDNEEDLVEFKLKYF